MSKKYYRYIDKAMKNQAYLSGRAFEYRVMAILRRHGYHCMRRFGSQGVVFCAKCRRNVSRRTYTCSYCKTKKYVLKASLDVTAYKNGVYIMITCKFSQKRGTNYLDDEYWENMVLYASFYDAIPVFAGVTPDNKTYLVDLRSKSNYLAWRYRYKSWVRPKDDQVTRLMNEAWSVIDRCNLMLGQSTIVCPKCGEEFEIPDCTESSEKKKPRWTEIKSKQLNIINKLLWRSGATATEDDLAQIFEKAEKQMKRERKEEAKKNET